MIDDAGGRPCSHLVIAGCGRSGTGHLSAVLNQLGYPCGHERGIRPHGFVGFGDQMAEASWFAPPYVEDLPDDTLIIHQVREPWKVISSFYRIGFFGDRPWRTVLVNPKRTASDLRYPSRLRRRLTELRAQRYVVATHTSIFEEPDELLRCYRYWNDWNQLPEEQLARAGRSHLFCRLESLDATFLHGVLERLNRPAPALEVVEATLRPLPHSNRMPEYRDRPIRWHPIDVVDGLGERAARYGYHSIAESAVRRVRSAVMISVVVAAYNEATVIRRLLGALVDSGGDDLDIVVVCNGCTDDTADVARSFGPPVRVIETPIANKSSALNLGDEAARDFPRFYVDADASFAGPVLRDVARALEQPGVLAAAPALRADTSHSSWAVRTYCTIWQRLPQVRESLAGRGVYAVSAEGRQRFERFPELLNDDGYVSALFSDGSGRTVRTAGSVVRTPQTLRDLVRRRVRVSRGNTQLRSLGVHRHDDGGLPGWLRAGARRATDRARIARLSPGDDLCPPARADPRPPGHRCRLGTR